MNMCSFYENSETKDHAGLLFLAFVIMNNIILFNIFVGLVVGIGMEYSKEIFENDRERAENEEIEKREDSIEAGVLGKSMMVDDSHIMMEAFRKSNG